MSALAERITELLVDHTFVPGDDETPGECTSSACLWKGWFLGDWRRHVAEQITALFTEEQYRSAMAPDDCDYDRVRWVFGWIAVEDQP